MHNYTSRGHLPAPGALPSLSLFGSRWPVPCLLIAATSTSTS